MKTEYRVDTNHLCHKTLFLLCFFFSSFSKEAAFNDFNLFCIPQRIVDATSLPTLEFVHKMQVSLELKNLQKILMDICAVLDDAENKQMEDSLVKDWLRDVRDLKLKKEITN